MALPDPFTFIAVDKELVCQFFAVFSRFEFALKECGYVRDQNGRAAPDWGRFKDDCKLTVAATDPLHGFMGYLIANPPQVQEPNLKWMARPLRGTTDEAKALESIQRVRNNLFHGGKHPPLSLPGRDEQLVKASLAMLHACLEQHPQLLSEYETTIF
jgi:hypothetical protein